MRDRWEPLPEYETRNNMLLAQKEAMALHSLNEAKYGRLTQGTNGWYMDKTSDLRGMNGSTVSSTEAQPTALPQPEAPTPLPIPMVPITPYGHRAPQTAILVQV